MLTLVDSGRCIHFAEADFQFHAVIIHDKSVCLSGKGGGLKIHCRQLRAGSNPAADTLEQHLPLPEQVTASAGDRDQDSLTIAERGFDPRTFGL